MSPIVAIVVGVVTLILFGAGMGLFIWGVIGEEGRKTLAFKKTN